jgi:hypothetical protein
MNWDLVWHIASVGIGIGLAAGLALAVFILCLTGAAKLAFWILDY